MSGVAYLFPGQGSQSVGMLGDVKSEVAEDFEEASGTLGYDLWALVQEGPEEKLGQTEFTQPALLAASVALYRLARRRGAPAPQLVAGHSLGEYSALVAVGALSLADAAGLVQQRGRFMQSAVPLGQGGMAAVMKLPDAEVLKICEEASSQGLVQPANFNAPGQLVIAGETRALAAASEACQAAGARVLPLAVSAPFHTRLMKPAAAQMAEALGAASFKAPEAPIIQNVDASPQTDPEALRANLVTQMHSPVRWTETIQRTAAEGVGTLVECGPGKVLAGLAKRIDGSLRALGVNGAESLAATLRALGHG